MAAAAMYKNFARSHDGTNVAAVPERDVTSDELNQATKSHGGEVFDPEANAQAAEEASALDTQSADLAETPAATVEAPRATHAGYPVILEESGDPVELGGACPHEL